VLESAAPWVSARVIKTSFLEGHRPVSRIRIFNWVYYAINGLALVWNRDWALVDDSAIVPEAIPKKNIFFKKSTLCR
jgi:hypothetical protein